MTIKRKSKNIFVSPLTKEECKHFNFPNKAFIFRAESGFFPKNEIFEVEGKRYVDRMKGSSLSDIFSGNSNTGTFSVGTTNPKELTRRLVELGYKIKHKASIY